MLFTGKLAAYREQIDAGNIALSGEGKEAAKVAERNVLEAQKIGRSSSMNLGPSRLRFGFQSR
jgi:hypothetical protein